jgi:hypothetical protein
VVFLRAPDFFAPAFLRAPDFFAPVFFRAVDFRAVVFLRAVDLRAVLFFLAGDLRAVVFLRAADFFVDLFFVAFLAPEDAFLAGLTMPPFVNAVLYAWLLPMKTSPRWTMPSGRGLPVGSPSALVQELLVHGAR